MADPSCSHSAVVRVLKSIMLMIHARVLHALQSLSGGEAEAALGATMRSPVQWDGKGGGAESAMDRSTETDLASAAGSWKRARGHVRTSTEATCCLT